MQKKLHFYRQNSQSMISKNKLEKCIAELFSAEELKAHNMYALGKIPFMTIPRLSTEFKGLDLSKEEIFLLYDLSEANINSGFIITDKKIYYNQEDGTKHIELLDSASLLDENNWPKGFMHPDSNIMLKLKELIAKLNAEEPEQKKKDLKTFVEKYFRSEEAELDLLIDRDMIEALQKEGEQWDKLLKELNEDPDFLQALNAMNQSPELKDQFRANHVILHDLISIFKKIKPSENEELYKKQKFILAYFFERLNSGTDMAKGIALPRLNQMVFQNGFEENIKKIVGIQLFKLDEKYNDELLTPSILIRTEHPAFSAVSTGLYRYASLLVKADGEVNAEEEELLRTIWNLANNPKKNLFGVKQTEAPKDETLENVLSELEGLVGLDSIKKEIKSLANLLTVHKMRLEQGMAGTIPSLHSVFSGPPGTGKTTVARLVARIFKHLGYLDKGQLIETDRAGLVAGYVGQTAIKVDEVVKTSLGGVLFIDEAYSLNKGEGGKDFGSEAIEILLKRMEDHRENLVVIAAGYTDEMRTFVQSNPGLESRFNRFYFFDHYTGGELLAIFKRFASKADFELSPDAEDKLSFILDEFYENRYKGFGNARVVRNLFEEIVQRQANRIVTIAPITAEILRKIEEPDIPEQNATARKYLQFKPTEEGDTATNTSQSSPANTPQEEYKPLYPDLTANEQEPAKPEAPVADTEEATETKGDK